jgi:hypothetical protein
MDASPTFGDSTTDDFPPDFEVKVICDNFNAAYKWNNSINTYTDALNQREPLLCTCILSSLLSKIPRIQQSPRTEAERLIKPAVRAPS